MSRRPRAPTPEDLRLWREVAKTVTPIGRDVPDWMREDAPEPAVEPAAATAKRAKAVAGPAPMAARKAPARPAGAPAPAALDRRTVGKVARGRMAIDARLDLHGLTQEAAHRRLAAFLHEAQVADARLVLVITGKGDPEGRRVYGAPERGVLRRSVPHWLGSAEFRPWVVGYGEAARHHGGAGALYVRIRRRRAG